MTSDYLNYNFLKNKIFNINETRNNFPFFKYSKKKDIRKAAVIILIINNNLKQVVFTKRTKFLKNHPNQISFPGGTYEKQDKTLYDTATREVCEEIGIKFEQIEMVKQLKPQDVRTGFQIHPFVAFIPSDSNFQIDKYEVDRIIKVPIIKLLDTSCYKMINVRENNYEYSYPEFYYNGEKIWGATASILYKFIFSIK
jgi:8-oxo-dGTP pyrophosphatase MutT (NUDIX family)